MSFRKVFTIAISLIAFISCKKDDNVGKFIESSCPLELPTEILESGKFLYGHMEVPELSQSPNGNTVELAVAIFKCRSDTVLQDPLVLCAGGPGLSNIDDFVPTLTGDLGDLLLDTRDVVIIETRGLKYSKPSLHIPELDSLQLSLLDKNLTVDQTIDLYLDELKTVYSKWENNGINLSAFNSFEISNEIAYVMQQLGYEKFSFFGTSYGTEIAQYLIINHTDKLASVAMNGTMDITLGGHHMHTSLISTMESLFEKLQSTAEYSEAYPNLKDRFLERLEELNQDPDTINLKYWKTQEDYEVVLNGNRIALWIFHQMYSSTQIQRSMYKIVNGDYSEIIAYPGLIFPIPEFSAGLNLSVFLSETKNIEPSSIPIESEYSTLIKGASLSLFGPYFLNKADNVWPVDEIKPPKQIETDIPILLLSGKMDYLCRPSYAKQFAEKQENAYLYIFEDVAHSPVDKGDCAIMMLLEFFDNPDKAPNNSCMNEYQHVIAMPE